MDEPLQSDKPSKNLILFAFGLSGACSLVYQVIWVRQLTYILGASLFSISLVVSAFMLGLALGSISSGYLIDRYFNPLRIYGVLELCIGLLAFFISKIFLNYFHFLKIFNGIAPYPDVMRFVTSFILLLIPSLLMGATLPVLSRLTANKGSGLTVGKLYAINILGAVLGSFLAGFVAIPAIGMLNTINSAIFINMIIGIIALYLSIKNSNKLEVSKFDGLIRSGSNTTFMSPTIKIVLISYALSGAISLSYQVLWMRSLIYSFQFSANTTYSFSAILIVFLAGLSFGSLIFSYMSHRIKEPLKMYSLTQLLLGTSVLISFLLIIYILPSINLFGAFDEVSGKLSWIINVINIFIKTIAAVFIPTTLMGIMFPLVISICMPNKYTIGYTVGRVFYYNTIGSMIGPILTGFFLIPLFGIAKVFLILISLNLIVSLILVSINSKLQSQIRNFSIIFGLIVFTLIIFYAPKRITFNNLINNQKLLFYKEGAQETVSVVNFLDGNYIRLAIDGVEVGGSDPVMLTDQKTLAHIPMLVSDNPKSALSIGLGTGVTSSSFLKYKELKRVDVLEISSPVLEASRLFNEYNNNLLQRPRNPRLHIITGDARSFLHLNESKYDVIGIDCTDLRYKTNASLYTSDFFQLAKKNLTSKGSAIVWLPLGKLSPTSFKSILKSFSEIYPYSYAWYLNNYPTHYMVLMGKNKPLEIDYEKLLDRLSSKEISRDLKLINLNNPIKILSSFVADNSSIKKISGNAPENSENYPFIEFNAPRFRYAGDDRFTLNNLFLLIKEKKRVIGYIKNIPKNQQSEIKKKFELYEAALPYILKGHDLIFKKQYYSAYKAYEKAFSLNPGDSTVNNFLNFR